MNDSLAQLLGFLAYLATLVAMLILNPRSFRFTKKKKSSKADEETSVTLDNSKNKSKKQ